MSWNSDLSGYLIGRGLIGPLTAGGGTDSEDESFNSLDSSDSDYLENLIDRNEKKYTIKMIAIKILAIALMFWVVVQVIVGGKDGVVSIKSIDVAVGPVVFHAQGVAFAGIYLLAFIILFVVVQYTSTILSELRVLKIARGILPPGLFHKQAAAVSLGRRKGGRGR